MDETEHKQIADKRIGNFNPSDRDDVAIIKQKAKDLIEEISQHCPAGRRKQIAFTKIEEAAMMAVKSLFEG